MTEPNKKRYVYLDKYLDYQNQVSKKLSKINTKIDLLTYGFLGMIVAVSLALYKIFG